MTKTFNSDKLGIMLDYGTQLISFIASSALYPSRRQLPPQVGAGLYGLHLSPLTIINQFLCLNSHQKQWRDSRREVTALHQQIMKCFLFIETRFRKSRFPSPVLEMQEKSAWSTKGKLTTNKQCVLLLQPDAQPNLPALFALETIHSATLLLATMKSQNFVISKEVWLFNYTECFSRDNIKGVIILIVHQEKKCHDSKEVWADIQ